MSVSEYFSKSRDEFKIFEEQGIDPVVARYGEAEIAYPTNEKEYCALGGYAFMKITAIAEDQNELPIERAYFQMRNGKIMSLESLEVSVEDKPHFTNIVIEAKDDKDRVYYKSFSFWAIPTLCFIDNEGLIAIDFKGGRKHFVILRGPWKQAIHTYEWVQKHISGQMQFATGPVGYDLIASFVQREFMSRSK